MTSPRLTAAANSTRTEAEVRSARTPGYTHDFATCRFCGKDTVNASDDMVKYGVRHYAHFQCYLDAGKGLDDLHAWQLGKFPYRLLQDRGLLSGVEKRVAEDRRGK